MRRASGHNYRNNSFIVDVAMGQNVFLVFKYNTFSSIDPDSYRLKKVKRNYAGACVVMYHHSNTRRGNIVSYTVCVCLTVNVSSDASFVFRQVLPSVSCELW